MSPIAYWAREDVELLELAAASAVVSHDHPDAVAGAQAVALAMWLARGGEIRAWYRFDVSCKGTVPPAIACALEAEDYQEAVRNAISLGGDSDTLACITGGIAEILYGLPDDVARASRERLDAPLRTVVDRFYASVGADA